MPPKKKGTKAKGARRVLAGAVVTSLFVAPTVTAALAAPADHSEAFGQVINVDGLGLDLAEAGYSYSANPSSSTAQANPLNVSALNGAVDLTLPTINLPVISDDGSGLLDLGQAGALSSYAIADTATHAKGSAGVLGADGALAVDTSSGDLATVDLTKLFGQLGIDGVTTDVLDVAELQLGALGSTTERTDGADPTHEYQIASATVDLHSPLLSDLSDTLTATTTGAGEALNGLVGAEGLVPQIVDALNAANVNLGLAELGLSNVALSIDGLPDVVATLNGVLTEELISESGLVSLNLGEGTVQLDLSKAITGGLNDQPANTKLLDDAVALQVSEELTGLLEGVTTKLTTALNEVLDQASFTLTADVNAEVAILGDLVDGGINLSGSLGDFLNGNTENFTVNNTLVLLPGLGGGIDLGGVLDSVVGLVMDTTAPLLSTVTGLVNALPGTVDGLVTDVVAPVIDGAIEPLLAGVLEITINEQGTIASSEISNPAASPAAAQIVAPAPEGELNYVTALAIDVLPDVAGVGVDLGTSAVRAAAEATDTEATDAVDADTEATDAVDTEATDAVDTEATDAVDTEATDAVDTEATDAVDTEATDAVDTEATDAVDTEATDAVDTEATDAVDADTEATDAVDADTEATDAVDADTEATDADATDADATDADATDADATDADATDADATDAMQLMLTLPMLMQLMLTLPMLMQLMLMLTLPMLMAPMAPTLMVRITPRTTMTRRTMTRRMAWLTPAPAPHWSLVDLHCCS
ncbi:choice-of-anchor G family protein [Arthrobacter sp. MYb216]|uniref:choice-of-anchor G family protein n=1 Tax=Arthrobacter sp. MYb216 TaxID=1848597 RepID=UPI0015E401E4|nr:choice-of-anchor G family protein [Arthrobacter sp. MYb216]